MAKPSEVEVVLVAPTSHTQDGQTLYVWEWQQYFDDTLPVHMYNFAAVVSTHPEKYRSEHGGILGVVYERCHEHVLHICNAGLRKRVPHLLAALRHACATNPALARGYPYLGESRALKEPLTYATRRSRVRTRKGVPR